MQAAVPLVAHDTQDLGLPHALLMAIPQDLMVSFLEATEGLACVAHRESNYAMGEIPPNLKMQKCPRV